MRNKLFIGLIFVNLSVFANPLPYSLSGSPEAKKAENKESFALDFSGVNDALLSGLKKNTNNKTTEQVINKAKTAIAKPVNNTAPVVNTKKTAQSVQYQNKKQFTKNPAIVRKSKNRQFCSGYIKSSTKDQINGAVVIDVSSGENIILPISDKYLNKVSTPFKKVSALSSSKSMSTLRKGIDKNVLMVSSKDGKTPSSMFLQDKFGNTANVTFIPCRIPPQNITLTYKENMKGGAGIDPFKPRKKAELWEKSNDYVSKVSEIMEMVAKGDIPTGYEYEEVENSPVGIVCKTKNLYGKLHQVLEGSNMRVAVYLAKNRSANILHFKEKNCYAKNVLSVAAHPSVKLSPGEYTEIFVLLKKNIESVKKNTRKMIIK